MKKPYVTIIGKGGKMRTLYLLPRAVSHIKSYVLVCEQLGHADPITTKIYAYADSEMKRKAIEKADQHHGNILSEVPIWEDGDDMIMAFAGLK